MQHLRENYPMNIATFALHSSLLAYLKETAYFKLTWYCAIFVVRLETEAKNCDMLFNINDWQPMSC